MRHGFPLMEMGLAVFSPPPGAKVPRFMEIVTVAQQSVSANLLCAFAEALHT